MLPPVPGLPCPTPAAMLAAPLAPEYAESCRAGSCQDSASFSHPKIQVFVSCHGCGNPWLLGTEPLSCPLCYMQLAIVLRGHPPASSSSVGAVPVLLTHAGRYPKGMAPSCCQEDTLCRCHRHWAAVTRRGQAASCPRSAVPAAWGPALSPCGVEPGAASRLLGGGIDPCVGEVLEQGHVHVGLRGNPSQERDVTVSPSPLPPAPAAHGHGAGARRAARGRCWGALGGFAQGWRAGGPPVPRFHSPSGPPACG